MEKQDKKNHSLDIESQYRQNHASEETYTANYRGEIYSIHLRGQEGVSYFFNLKENRESDIYLNIVESRTQRQSPLKDKKFERHSIMIFLEQREEFAQQSLAGLQQLSAGKAFQMVVKNPQRNFIWTTQVKRNIQVLSIAEERQSYGRIIQDQVIIYPNLAIEFSSKLIEVFEKWIECQTKEKQQNHTKKKLVVRKYHRKQED